MRAFRLWGTSGDVKSPSQSQQFVTLVISICLQSSQSLLSVTPSPLLFVPGSIFSHIVTGYLSASSQGYFFSESASSRIFGHSVWACGGYFGQSLTHTTFPLRLVRNQFWRFCKFLLRRARTCGLFSGLSGDIGPAFIG